MAKFTLKTYYGSKELERYDHRSPDKLVSILSHPRMHKAGNVDGWGNPLRTADRFEIYDSQMEKLYEGGITGALNYAEGLG